MATLLNVTLAVFFGVFVSQSRPDFAGTWTEAHDGYGGTGNQNRTHTESLQLGPPPHTVVVAQSANTLTVEAHYVAGGTGRVIRPRNTVVYRTDGTPAKNQIVLPPTSDRPFFLAPAQSTTQWKGDSLVSTIDVLIEGEDAPRRYQQTLSLSGDRLVVQISRVGTGHSSTITYRRK